MIDELTLHTRPEGIVVVNVIAMIDDHLQLSNLPTPIPNPVGLRRLPSCRRNDTDRPRHPEIGPKPQYTGKHLANDRRRPPRSIDRSMLVFSVEIA